MIPSINVCILVTALVIYLLRVLPLTLIRRQIKNTFVRSVLFYLPYVTLTVMTFPAIMNITQNPLCGLAGLLAAGAVAWFTSNLFGSAVIACIMVFVTSMAL